MAKGTIAATAVSSELVPASANRHEVVLQHISGDPVYLAFGETPVVDQGLCLWENCPTIIINDHRAGEAINGICDSGESASGTWTTDR